MKYIDFLICYNNSCYQDELDCKKDPICQILWNQFQKCQKRSRYDYQNRQCVDEYIGNTKNTKTGYLIENLHGCYDRCSGQNLFVCNKYFDSFFECQSQADCYEKNMTEFDIKMQDCILNNKEPCKNYLDINQCHLAKTYECIELNSHQNNMVQMYTQCLLDKQFSILLSMKAILGLVIIMFIM